MPHSVSNHSTMDYPSYIGIALLIILFTAEHVDRVVAEDSTEENSSVESLNEETCSEKRSECCSKSKMKNPNLLECLRKLHKNLPEGQDDSVREFSCIVECFYKKKRYIGKGDTLNMRMVRRDAKRQYAKRPKEMKYYIDSYEQCSKLVDKNSTALMPKGCCRPYFTLLYWCQANYHTKYECPYFLWQDNEEGEHECKDAREKCYEIDVAAEQVDRVPAKYGTQENTSLESLNVETCSKKRSGCCSMMRLLDHPNLIKCSKMQTRKQLVESEANDDAGLRHLSCFMDCFYKKSKYITKGGTLNMKIVKLDAAHVYAKRPKEKEYYIKAYDECNKRIITELGLIKNTSDILPANSCRPFFTLLFMCHANYHTKHDCPYFRWDDESEEKHDCKDARDMCYKMDDLEVPVDIDTNVMKFQ